MNVILILITLIIIVLPIVFLFVYAAGRRKKVEAILELMDAKIVDFKSKTFASVEEKENAKSELKTELLKMKDGIRDMGSINAVLAFRERVLSKILEL
jgi:predicted Zn-dependent peptidase